KKRVFTITKKGCFFHQSLEYPLEAITEIELSKKLKRSTILIKLSSGETLPLVSSYEFLTKPSYSFGLRNKQEIAMILREFLNLDEKKRF
ncbi:MAG: hypothetical protein SAJ37_23425, partial [Oscillatoria sp. PMC 1068.18]|nr:hypothetical protein [Oscillatoria sp. PMC 1068.18]